MQQRFPLWGLYPYSIPHAFSFEFDDTWEVATANSAFLRINRYSEGTKRSQGFEQNRVWVKTPLVFEDARTTLSIMNLLVVLIVLMLLFGGGGFTWADRW